MNLKSLLLLLLLLLLFILAACAAQPQTITFAGDIFTYKGTEGDTVIYQDAAGQSLRVQRDGEQAQVSVGTQVYQVSGRENEVNVIFPDGRELTRQYSETSSTGLTGVGTSASMEDWIKVDQLRAIVFPQAAGQNRGPLWPKIVIALMIGGVGLLQIINPYLAWQMEQGWKYKNLEPSDTYLVLSRIAGAGLIVIGLAILFFE